MKKLVFAFLIMGSMASVAIAQRSKVTVLNIDTKGITLDPVQMGSLVRTELDKLDTFEVMDKYDVNYVIEKNKLNTNNCYGKICLIEVGKIINADLMLTGSAEILSKSIVVTLKMIDVKKEEVQHTEIIEFLDLQEELQTMVGVTLRRMFGKKEDAILLDKLTKKNTFASTVNTPQQDILHLSGPRMGCIAFTGAQAELLLRKTEAGGYDAFPVMFQFGYQFEKQYLNEGNFQALLEFIPMITGLDQGKFLPSISILNGLRSNVSGWEFAFGPSFSIDHKAKGFIDSNGSWQLKEDWTKANPNLTPPPTETRSDSRGDIKFTSHFVIAAGKTIKSGKMNIPINAFFIPTKNGMRFGISFGYNAKPRR